MPWDSKAQQAWGHTEDGKKQLGDKKVKEYDQATNFKKLVRRKHRKKAISGYNLSKGVGP